MLIIEGVKFYSVKETADLLHLTPLTVRKYIQKGRLRALRIGRPYYIREEYLKEFITEM
jgi:excisionase family DNA binding protein